MDKALALGMFSRERDGVDAEHMSSTGKCDVNPGERNFRILRSALRMHTARASKTPSRIFDPIHPAHDVEVPLQCDDSSEKH